jgi:hypothetical protein
MRALSLLAAAMLALSGCGPAVTGATDVPAGFTITETMPLPTAAACEALVRDRTKGGAPQPQPHGNVTAYEQTLNSGRRVWQSCTVDSSGGVLYIMAVAATD